MKVIKKNSVARIFYQVVVFNFVIAIFLFTVAAPVLCYKEPIPETIYSMSDNQQYLLQIIPMFETGAEGVEHGIERNSLIIIIYKKTSTEIEGMKDKILSWEEVSFFRVKHRHNVHKGFAEAKRGLISNDGNRIILQAREHPLALTDIKALFIYDRFGNQIGSYSTKDIFNVESNFSREGISLSIDNETKQLQIRSKDGIVKIIDFKNGNLIN